MKQTLYLSLTILILIFLSCKNDITNNINNVNENKNENSLESITKVLIEQDTIKKLDSDTLSDQINKAENKKEDNLEKIKIKKKILKEKRKKVIEEKYKNSKFKGMTCEEIILKYKKIIEEYQKTKNDELLLWKDPNDPIYISCYKKHKAVFDSLERIENEIGIDEDEIY